MQWLNIVQQRKKGRNEKKGTIETALKILPQCKRKKKNSYVEMSLYLFRRVEFLEWYESSVNVNVV